MITANTGNDGKADDGQLGVPGQHYDDDSHKAQDLGKAHDENGHELLEGHGVVLDAAHQAPHLVVVEEERGLLLQMVMHFGPQLVEHCRVDPR